MLAFEPFSCAVLACAIEHIVCSSRPRALIPRARVWIRRNSEHVLDAVSQEITEPVLDITNTIDVNATIAAIALLMIARAVLMLPASHRRR